MAEPPVTFAALLRKLRTDAGLTQEDLAASARISVRWVSDLERGINLTARKDTARLLAQALNLVGPAGEGVGGIARGRARRAPSPAPVFPWIAWPRIRHPGPPVRSGPCLATLPRSPAVSPNSGGWWRPRRARPEWWESTRSAEWREGGRRARPGTR